MFKDTRQPIWSARGQGRRPPFPTNSMKVPNYHLFSLSEAKLIPQLFNYLRNWKRTANIFNLKHDIYLSFVSFHEIAHFFQNPGTFQLWETHPSP